MANQLFHAFSDFFRKLVDMGDGSHAEQIIAHPPFDLLTDGGTGTKRRIRVDVGQTGFFTGREFRTFREFNIATGSSLVVKVVVPINIILFGIRFDLISGSLKVETVVGGTEGGSFSGTLPIIPANAMSERPTPIYATQVVATDGGTHTGGTVIDVIRAQTSGQGSQVAGVGSSAQDERGVAAGTYYFRLTASGSDASVGVLKARWEERP